MRRGTDADPPFGTAVRAALCLSTCEVDFWQVVNRDDHEGAVFPIVSAWTLARGVLPWVAGVLLVLGAWAYVERLQRARDSALAGQAATMQALGNETAARQAVTAALVRADQVMAAREAEIRTLEAKARSMREGLYEAMAQPESVPWAAARVPAAVLDRLREAAADRDDAGRDPDAADGAAD